MHQSNMSGSVLRALCVISSIAVMVTGVTFASLQSTPATLTGNTIDSATADLRIGTSATSFASSRSGFSFHDIVPGGSAVPLEGNIIYLKNYGSAKLELHLAISNIPVNSSAVDLSKVSLQISRVDTGATQTFTIDSLLSSFPTGGVVLTDSLAGNTVAQYKLRAIMGIDAFVGTEASITNIDFSFSGVALGN